MNLLTKLQDIAQALNEIITLTGQAQTALTNFNTFLDSL